MSLLPTEISDDIRRTLWEKYVFLVGLSGTTTTMRSTIGPIREHPQTRAFLYDVMKEVVDVGRAHKVNLPADYADQRLAFVDGVPAVMTSSIVPRVTGTGRNMSFCGFCAAAANQYQPAAIMPMIARRPIIFFPRVPGR